MTESQVNLHNDYYFSSAFANQDNYFGPKGVHVREVPLDVCLLHLYCIPYSADRQNKVKKAFVFVSGTLTSCTSPSFSGLHSNFVTCSKYRRPSLPPAFVQAKMGDETKLMPTMLPVLIHNKLKYTEQAVHRIQSGFTI